jgi:hypothetical protein
LILLKKNNNLYTNIKSFSIISIIIFS